MTKDEESKKNKRSVPVLYVVLPCYNEEKVLRETTKRLRAKLRQLIASGKVGFESKVMYVNDGSKDATWELIKDTHRRDSMFTGISLSRNRGHQNALLAGLLTARKYADVVISMDADLQDDVAAIDEMLKKYEEGCEVVYAVRSAREMDTFFKRVSAEAFYKFMKVLGVECVYNHADYRLASRRVLDELDNFHEVNLFLRGMFPLLGFKSDVVYYERKERFAGESKRSIRDVLNFTWDGALSFTMKPLRLICMMGIAILVVSLVVILFTFMKSAIEQKADGWTFLIISIWFMGGLQMASLGVVGEYIGKIYSETKARPRFILSENLEEK